jgi:hypothetical protein
MMQRQGIESTRELFLRCKKSLAILEIYRYIDLVAQIVVLSVRLSPPPSSFGVDLRGIARVVPRFFLVIASWRARYGPLRVYRPSAS